MGNTNSRWLSVEGRRWWVETPHLPLNKPVKQLLKKGACNRLGTGVVEVLLQPPDPLRDVEGSQKE
jgi:hypothetical protein